MDKQQLIVKIKAIGDHYAQSCVVTLKNGKKYHTNLDIVECAVDIDELPSGVSPQIYGVPVEPKKQLGGNRYPHTWFNISSIKDVE